MRSRLARALFLPLLALPLLAAVPGQAPPASTPPSSVHYVPTVGDAVIRVEVQRDPRFDEGGQPVLLTYSPYNSIGDALDPRGMFVADDGLAARYNPRGIARAVADVLGTRGSTGCWDYGGADETRSGVDVVRFLAGEIPDVDGTYLEWSNGNVGMTGVSYEGTTATMVASAAPEALKAIVPIAAISHWYGYAFHDGVRYFLNSEHATDEGFDTPLLFDHGIGDTFHPDNPDSAVARADECDAVEHEQQAYSRNPDYTDFWVERDYTARADAFRAATLVVHGWNDYNVKQDEAIRLYEALPVDDPSTREADGVPVKLLWMTQSAHADGSGDGYQQLLDDFWAAYLLEDPAARGRVLAAPRVRTEPETTTGATGQVTRSPSWPLPGTETHTLFLNRTYEQDVDGVTVPGPGTGEVGELSYRNRWEGPLAGREGAYGPTSGWLDTGLATEELSRNDPWSNDGKPGEGPGGQGYYALAFSTTPLTEDVRIAGRAVLEGVFRFLAERQGATITPILVDIAPDDSYKTIQRGFLSLAYRDGREQRAAAPDGWTTADVTFLPEDYVVPEGHRIGLLLQSSNTVWAVPGDPAGFVAVGLGPREGVTEHGARLHLPLVRASERIFEDYPDAD